MRTCTLLLAISAACVSPPTPPPATTSRPSATEIQPVSLLADLAGVGDAGSMREQLRSGFTARELAFVGFDDVSLAQCIDEVVVVILASRAAPEDAVAAARAEEAAHTFVDVRREVLVRRMAGAASCIPTRQ